MAVTSITVEGDFLAAANGCGTTLPASSSCNITIAFNPKTTGPQTGELRIGTDAGDHAANLFGYGEQPLPTVASSMIVPIVARTASYGTEIYVRNIEAVPLTLAVTFEEADNSSTPGPKECASFALPALATRLLSLAQQCSLATGSHFGSLRLEDVAANGRFAVFSRSSTPAGAGFSVEGLAVTTLGMDPAYVEGLQRTSQGAHYLSNCFVGALDQPVDYRIDLLTASDEAIGSPITGSLAPHHSMRFLDILAAAGAPVGDYASVRARFSQSGTSSPFLGFCTVQESVTF
jgi:hypothetical protein